MRLTALAVWVALAWGLIAAAAPRSPDLTQAAAFPELRERHQRVMQPLADAFATHTVRIDYLEGEPETGERIAFFWQDGKYRKEFYWVGFTEVFGFDGAAHWHGSDYNLPRMLDGGESPDLTAQLIGYFAYLRPEYAQYLGPAAGVAPLSLGDRFVLLRFAPPGMSEALVLLDPLDFRLAGMLIGNDHALAESVMYTLTLYEDWADYGPAWYPAVIRIERRSPEGELLRERRITTQGVTYVDALPAVQFSMASSPMVARPELPQVPYEVPFSYLNDTVVVRCQTPDGRRRRLELDTGANVGLLREDVARKLGLELKNHGQITGHGGSARVQYVRVEGLRLEGANRDYAVELPPWPAAVLVENSGLDDALADKGVEGLLGNFLLHNFVVKIDFRRRKMWLYPPGRFDPALHLGAGYHAVPVVRDTMPYVEVEVDGAISGGAFFNTGAQHFFALQAWAIDDAGLLYQVESVGTGITVHGLTAFGIIHPGQVRVGEIVILEPRTHLEVLAPAEPPNRNQIASFGNDFFDQYTVTFDLFHQVYYIEGVRDGRS
jgi:hypothetical protein